MEASLHSHHNRVYIHLTLKINKILYFWRFFFFKVWHPDIFQSGNIYIKVQSLPYLEDGIPILMERCIK